ncbi:hypothetical protein [Nonomuraea longispora]|nr:hypothetical protein [Nonomuraea longispora]
MPGDEQQEHHAHDLLSAELSAAEQPAEQVAGVGLRLGDQRVEESP